MGRVSLFLVVSISCFGFAGNQNPSPSTDAEETPTFRTGTRLVQVDVVVRGKDAPIQGLTRDDFEVTDNGKRQQVSVFAVRTADRSDKKSAPLPAGVVANRPVQTGPEPVTATLILMDRLNTDFGDQAFARAQALKYMERAGNREQIAVYSLNQTLTVAQSFTDDHDALHRAIQKTTSEMPTINQEILQGIPGNSAAEANLNAFKRRATITSAALELIARHLKGLPGRKKLVWITAALPLTLTQEMSRNDIAIQEFSNLSPPLFAATRVLNDANVAIYTIDPRGVFPGVLMDPNIAAMVSMTQMTGGKAFYADNDLVTGIEQAVTDTDLTYTLGFYQTEGAVDGEFHSVSVKVLRNRAESRDITDEIKDIRYRRGYNAQQPRKPLTEKQRKGTLNAWVDEPVDATELNIQAAAVPAKNKVGYYDVEVAVDPRDLQLEQKNNRWVGAFELAIVPDVDNKPKGLHQTIQVNLSTQGFADALVHGIQIVNQVQAGNSKGKLFSQRLHLVVMDATSGKAGSVRIPLVP